jgi:hypothetical protein
MTVPPGLRYFFDVSDPLVAAHLSAVIERAAVDVVGVHLPREGRAAGASRAFYIRRRRSEETPVNHLRGVAARARATVLRRG